MLTQKLQKLEPLNFEKHRRLLSLLHPDFHYLLNNSVINIADRAAPKDGPSAAELLVQMGLDTQPSRVPLLTRQEMVGGKQELPEDTFVPGEYALLHCIGHKVPVPLDPLKRCLGEPLHYTVKPKWGSLGFLFVGALVVATKVSLTACEIQDRLLKPGILSVNPRQTFDYCLIDPIGFSVVAAYDGGDNGYLEELCQPGSDVDFLADFKIGLKWAIGQREEAFNRTLCGKIFGETYEEQPDAYGNEASRARMVTLNSRTALEAGD